MAINYKRKADYILDILFPRKCVCCNEIIDDEEELCDNCLRFIERVDASKRCPACGLEKKSCQCKMYAYHFDSIVSPFYYEGIARKGFYNFKFNGKEHYGIFFAREMARTVISELDIKNFDAICYVPMSYKSRLIRLYNQSYVLAKHISELTNIPLIEHSLKRRFSLKYQHTKSREKRFKGVRKIFLFNKEKTHLLKNKRILLVDDVKTTGATLDECSRQLLFGGAKSVSCVTALITDQIKRERRISPALTQKRADKLLSDFGANIKP